MPAEHIETLDYYWSFRSHYCYLGLDRVLAIEHTFPIDIQFRPVYPLAIRTPEFFSSMPKSGPNRWAYIMHDAERIAERRNLSFAWPDPDPVIMDMDNFVVASKQPYIHRLTRLGVAAARLELGMVFAKVVSGLIFGGTKNWHEGNVMHDALAAVDVDLDRLDEQVSANPSDFDREIEANQEALAEAGHWGVPTVVFRGEPFFGQDRIIDLLWRMKQQGVEAIDVTGQQRKLSLVEPEDV
ncbi:MAG: 2-hydroxychromene-2-carboxylate isomerase [Gammaproteobacteria bacterium]